MLFKPTFNPYSAVNPDREITQQIPRNQVDIQRLTSLQKIILQFSIKQRHIEYYYVKHRTIKVYQFIKSCNLHSLKQIRKKID